MNYKKENRKQATKDDILPEGELLKLMRGLQERMTEVGSWNPLTVRLFETLAKVRCDCTQRFDIATLHDVY